MKHNSLPTVFAGLAVLAFVLTVIGSDLGAAQSITLRTPPTCGASSAIFFASIASSRTIHGG